MPSWWRGFQCAEGSTRGCSGKRVLRPCGSRCPPHSCSPEPGYFRGMFFAAVASVPSRRTRGLGSQVRIRATETPSRCSEAPGQPQPELPPSALLFSAQTTPKASTGPRVPDWPAARDEGSRECQPAPLQSSCLPRAPSCSPAPPGRLVLCAPPCPPQGQQVPEMETPPF